MFMVVRMLVPDALSEPWVVLLEPEDDGSDATGIDALHKLGERNIVDELTALSNCAIRRPGKVSVLVVPLVVGGATDSGGAHSCGDDRCLAQLLKKQLLHSRRLFVGSLQFGYSLGAALRGGHTKRHSLPSRRRPSRCVL